jgi:hypothetical protein
LASFRSSVSNPSLNQPYTGSLRRQGGTAQKLRFQQKAKSLFGGERFGRFEPLQRQFRLAAIKMKHRLALQRYHQTERVGNPLDLSAATIEEFERQAHLILPVFHPLVLRSLDHFELACRNGEIVRVLFAIDACDREAGWPRPRHLRRDGARPDGRLPRASIRDQQGGASRRMVGVLS